MRHSNLCCILLLACAFISLAHAQTIPSSCPCIAGTRVNNALQCFPFCNCVDYRSSSSPWYLSITSFQESAAGVSVTFQFKNVTSAPTTPSTCFQFLAANGVQKLQIDTFTGCNDNNTDIYIGPSTTACTGGCKVETPVNYADKRYFRIGSFTAQQAFAGTTFRIVGRGTCGTLGSLLKAPTGQVFSYTIYKEGSPAGTCCPAGCGQFPRPPPPPPSPPPPPPLLPPTSGTIPPPPPRPPTLFPHQSCKPGNLLTSPVNGIKGVPFNIDIRKVSTYPGATTGEHWCWVVNPQTCTTNPSYPGCCSISLDKIELAVKEGCRNSATFLKNIYAFGGLGSVKLSSSTGFVAGTANTPATNADVIKFTEIRFKGAVASLATIRTLAAARNNTICFTIDPKPACNTSAKLFLQPTGLSRGVQYAYWGTKPSTTAQCCGTEFTPFTTGTFTG